MNILGISAFYHDSAACLVQDGKITSAAQEERFTRKKHDPSFPKNSIQYCLQNNGLSANDLAESTLKTEYGGITYEYFSVGRNVLYWKSAC